MMTMTARWSFSQVLLLQYIEGLIATAAVATAAVATAVVAECHFRGRL
jgi:hypothetical protein